MSVEQVQKYFEGTPLEGGVIICKESSATVELAAGSSNSAIRISIEQLEEYTDYVAWVDVCKPMEEV